MASTRTTRRTPRARRAVPLSKPAAAAKVLRDNADRVLQLAGSRALAARRLVATTTRDVRHAVLAGAGAARSRTVQVVTRFERAFQDRVSRAISRLGVPSARDVRALSREVAQLQQSVDQLRRARARAS
ncbi:MAG TPA: phasin family protein [Usitatibacter sp.]|nr:phasin family protein [Usitatibacter sp.]